MSTPSAALAGELRELLLGLGVEEHIAGAVDPPCDRFNLVLDRLVVVVQVVKVRRPLTRLDDRSRELGRTGSAPSEAVVYVSGDCTGLDRQAVEQLELLAGIARTPIHQYCSCGRELSNSAISGLAAV
jgi:hypothetical protein